MNQDMKARVIIFATVGLVVALFVFRFEATAYFPETLPKLMPGVKLPSPKGYRWNTAKFTLVLALHVGCPHCENEMPFYEELLRLSQQNKIHAQVVAFFPDSKTEVAGEFSDRLVGLTKVTSVDLASLRVHGTPTGIVVDNVGVVRYLWVGELTSEEENSLILELKSD